MPLCSVRERGKACPGGQLDTRPRAPRPCSLAYGPAWDTLTWFAVLIGMSSALNDMGVIRAFADAISGSLTSLGLGPLPLCALLNAAYFFVHYLFASQTAHVGALYAAFMVRKEPLACYGMAGPSARPAVRAMHICYKGDHSQRRAATLERLLLCCIAQRHAHVALDGRSQLRVTLPHPQAIMLASGVPGVLGALTLAFTTNLFGSMTHYASGEQSAAQHSTARRRPMSCIVHDVNMNSHAPRSSPAGQSAVYFGAGFLKLEGVMKMGAILGMTGLLIWGVLGGLWWKVIGLI